MPRRLQNTTGAAAQGCLIAMVITMEKGAHVLAVGLGTTHMILLFVKIVAEKVTFKIYAQKK